MMDINRPIQITTGTMIRGIVLGLALYAAYLLFDIILVILTAVVLASAIEPIAHFLIRKRLPRVLAVLAIYLVFFVFFAFVVYVFVPPLFDELAGVATQLPAYIQSLDVLGSPQLTQLLQSFIPLKELLPIIGSTLSGAQDGIVGTASAVFGGAVNFFLIVVLSFYLAVQDQGIEDFLRLVTPPSHEEYVVDLWSRARKKIGLWMQGQLLLGVLIGVFAYLGLAILGIRYALLLAIMAAVFELIPVFGPTMAAVPAVLLGFGESTVIGFMVLGFYVILQQFENHLIYPLVVRKVVGVPPLLVILSLVVGGRLAGFLGVILAVPLASAFMEFIADIDKAKHPKSTHHA